jgi:hypothetical protein
MTKLILLILVGLGAALYFPDSRQFLAERSMPLLNPVFRWQTADEMDQIVRDLRTYEQEHYNQLPARDEWGAFLERTYSGDQTVDSWGSRYHYMFQRDSFVIVSYGPDKVYGTDDDIRNGGIRAENRAR